MTWKTRLLLRESAFTAVAFTLSSYAIAFVLRGMRDFMVPGPMRDYLMSPAIHIEILVIGVVFGGLIGVVSRYSETPRMRSLPLLVLVAVRTGIYLAGLVVAGLLVAGALHVTILPIDELREVWEAMTPRASATMLFWFAGTIAVIQFALEVERLVGPQNFWKLLLGRYRRPREEDRIFLFMDLKASTTTAEALGHERYSAFLQECFRDLTDVVIRYGAAIYQYVGDEVVLSWKSGEARPRSPECVNAFFAYQETLRRRQDHYEARYGVRPEFRGGIGAGRVTVSEVGDVKREIVYHGDVLNRAARLLELCKDRDEGLIVSGEVAESAEALAEVTPTWSGEVSLRGRQAPVRATAFRPV